MNNIPIEKYFLKQKNFSVSKSDGIFILLLVLFWKFLVLNLKVDSEVLEDTD